MDRLITWGSIALIVVMVILVGFFVFGKTVDTNETCAIVTLGKVSGIAGTGWNFRVPFITGFSCYNRQSVVYQTTDGAQGDADYLDFPVEIKTSDGQTANIEFNLSFHVDPENVIKVRSTVANDMRSLVTRIVANFSRSIPRDLSAKYSASTLYGIGRVDYGNEIEDLLIPLFSEYGVTLDEFELRDINFDEDYEVAIEQQQIARENIETAQFQAQQAEYEADRTAVLARGEADAEIQRARGDAEALRINAAAQADAINLTGAALEQNPLVLQLNFIESLESANWMLVPWEQIQPFLPLEGLSTGQ